ncbi:P-loop containing nucleoside triphosphate hydrolase protein [Chaetomidium leptoderma]|uniref:P-loop containing nucleoside triphosphate hydrolase protein n=1 Tax=Chaetomidium leptoderma TaxID=669021 RepID=A0AAN6VUZ7_9PEZI|nr:P-loop containing nucleoside triphosphate hydrolase protein [Chaetomidium leptoderma]
MDHRATVSHDVSSSDLPSTHRLPTVSAAQALQDLEGDDSNFISTGLAVLDASLGSGLDGIDRGGIQKGHVTEIWGPPGTGKTAFGIQLASNCLGKRRRVVWVDGFHRVPIERLRAVVGTGTCEAEDAGPGRLDGLTHYTCPSLPHLIALLCRPTASCIPQGTSLVVVDSLSALINHALPKLPETRRVTDAKGSKGPSASARRLQVLQYIVNSLQKLAATRDLAVVVLTQCATKMQAERGATLVPAINASVWEQGMSIRLVLFRDWLQEGAETRGLHFAAIQKLNGKAGGALVESVYAFDVEKGGLVSAQYDDTQQSKTLTSTPAQKRKLGDTGFEIADSEDEDYGLDDDEELPPMPSQWQGSEDLLLTREPESDEEDPSPDVAEVEDQEPDDAEPAKETDRPDRGSTTP